MASVRSAMAPSKSPLASLPTPRVMSASASQFSLNARCTEPYVDRGPTEVGTGVVRREASIGGVAPDDDQAIQERLRMRAGGADKGRSHSDRARRGHRRL